LKPFWFIFNFDCREQ